MAHGPHNTFTEFVYDVLPSFDWEQWTDWVGEWGVSRALFLSLLYAAFLFILSTQIPNFALFAFGWLVGTAPLWLPIALLVGFYRAWVWYTNSVYLSGRNPVLLEMKIPREVMKSPRAMEVALTGFWYSSGEVTFLHRVWKGQVRPFFSFEIASFGGEIHFYVWVWKAWKNAVEAHLYSQYPEIELVEVEDYAQKYVFDPSVHMCYCTDHRLEPPGPHIDAYPIKTYIDYELDKDPKEEFKIDPLASVLEFMSSIKPSQQVWLQIIFRQHGKTGALVQTDSNWKKMVQEEVEKIRLESAVFPKDIPEHLSEEQMKVARPRPTWKQTEQIRTMERNLGKLAFDVGLRGIFISKPEDFTSPGYTSVRWIWRPFANPNYMSHLRPRRWHNPFDYPWQDFHDVRWNIQTQRFLDAFRRRSFFHTPWETPHNIMTNEVIATLFHPPGRTVVTPGLTRISATKAPPPSNLPK